jgi:hypothetical protein
MTFRDAQGATFGLSAVTVVAWQSKTGDSIHLGVAGSPPRCAGRDPTPVAETRKFAVHREDERPAVAEALNRLNVALGLSELASRVESKRLCRRCSARYIPSSEVGQSAVTPQELTRRERRALDRYNTGTEAGAPLADRFARTDKRPAPVPESDLGLSEFQRGMPSVAESALQEALDDPPF